MRIAAKTMAALAGAALLAMVSGARSGETDAAACLSGGGGPDCIGIAAGVCMERPGGATTLGMVRCLADEAATWDARLNAAYGRRMAAARAEGAGRAGAEGAAPSQALALRDMQRAWIVFRDAACAYERALWGSGTLAGPAGAACLLEETARQALRLEALSQEETP